LLQGSAKRNMAVFADLAVRNRLMYLACDPDELRKGIDTAATEHHAELKCLSKGLPDLRFRPCERSGGEV
jgi:hypothetical protein